MNVYSLIFFICFSTRSSFSHSAHSQDLTYQIRISEDMNKLIFHVEFQLMTGLRDISKTMIAEARSSVL